MNGSKVLARCVGFCFRIHLPDRFAEAAEDQISGSGILN